MLLLFAERKSHILAKVINVEHFNIANKKGSIKSQVRSNSTRIIREKNGACQPSKFFLYELPNE